MSPPRWARWIPASAGALVALPVLIDLLVSDRRRPFGYLAADAFYYLTVARNMAHHGASSFDGALPTNGYHPLWQWMTAGLYGGNDLITGSEPLIIGLLVVVSAALVGVGTWLLARALTREAGPTPGLMLLPVGVFGLLVAPMWLSLGQAGVVAQSGIEGGRPLWGTAWIHVNGMESGLVALFFGLIAWAYVRGRAVASPRSAIAFGALLAGLTLARLDHGLIAATIAMGVAVEARLSGSSLRRIALLLVAFAAPVLAYLLMNKLLFGAAMPVSGTLKSSMPQLTNSNIDHIRRLVSAKPPAHWLPRAIRALQMVIPLVAALVWFPLWLRLRRGAEGVLVVARPGSGAFDRLLGFTALGVIALALHNFLFVGLFHQGSWYYPVSTVFVTLVALRAWGRLRRGAPLRPRLLLAGTLACGGLSLAAFFGLHRQPVRTVFADFYYEEAPKIRAHYGDDPPRLLSYDDGIVAFATGFPTLSGLGFTLDAAAVPAAKKKRLFELAMARGHDRLTSLVYFPKQLLGPGVERNVSRIVQGWPAQLSREAQKAHRFSLDYRSADGRFVIVRAQKRR